MKKLWSLFIVAVAVVVASCGGGSGSSSSAEGISGKLTAEKANEIIEYYNASLSVFKKKYKEDDREKILKYMGTRKIARHTIAPTVMDMPLVKKEDKTVKEPGTCFTEEVRAALKEDFELYFESGSKFMGNFGQYKDYLKAEDYKDDNWAQGDDLLAENQKLSADMEEAKARIYALISPLADAAEEVTLEDNPLKDHIMMAKQIFNVMEELTETIAEDQVSVEKVDKEYAALEAKVNQARELEKVEDYDRQMSRYDSFLSSVDKFMGVVRKAKRDNKFNQRAYDDMISAYNSTISSYNSFVN